jgi:hypothetical protein
MTLLLLLGSVHHAPALDLQMTFDTAGSQFPAFDPDGTQLTAIMQAVEAHYETLIRDDHVLTIDFRWADLSGGQTGLHELLAQENGRETAARVSLDTTTSLGSLRPWYFDPTPDSDEEFTMSQWLYGNLLASDQEDFFGGNPHAVFEAGFSGTPRPEGPSMNQNDALSVALHEVGHALGLASANDSTQAETGDGDYDVDPNFVAGRTLAVRTASSTDVAHLAGSAMVMSSIPAGQRRRPSAADVLAMAAAHNYQNLDLFRQDFLAGSDWHAPGNWLGASVPDGDDTALLRNPGNGPVSVSLSGDAEVANVLVAQGARLTTGNHVFRVEDLTKITGSGSEVLIQHVLQGAGLEIANQGRLVMEPGSQASFSGVNLAGGDVEIQSSATADFQTVNLGNGSSVFITGGTLGVNSTLNLPSTTSLEGHGDVFITDDLVNDGLIAATGGQTLAITVFGDIDLDGGQTAFGTVEAVDGNLRLDGTVTDPNDAFDSTLAIGGGHFVEFSQAWTLAPLGVLQLDRGTLDGASARIEGTVEVQGSGTSSLVAPADFRESSHVSIAQGAKLELVGTASLRGGSFSGPGELEQDGNLLVLADTVIDVDKYDMDGSAGRNQITVLDSHLTINSAQIDDNIASDGFDDALFLNSGRLTVNTAEPWRMQGTMTLAQTLGSRPIVSGTQMILEGTLEATGGTARIDAPLAIDAKAKVDVANGATLDFNGATTHFNGGQFTGEGLIRQFGHALVTAPTFVDVRRFDLDGTGATQFTLQSDLTLNVDAINQTGNRFAGTMTVVGLATMTVNFNHPTDSWEMAGELKFKGPSSGTPGTVLAGSDVALSGNVTFDGRGRFDSRIDLTGHIATVDAATEVRLAGGSSANPNTIAGGTITGPGRLRILEGAALVTDGTMDVHVINEGRIDIGAPIGTLQIAGDFTQTAAGDLRLELISATPSTGHDQLQVSGKAALNGGIEVVLGDGFLAAPGDQFQLVTAALVVGQFSHVKLPESEPDSIWAVSYESGAVRLGLWHSADFNQDLQVDRFDWLAWEGGWGTSGSGLPSDGDADRDGDIDGADLLAWQRQFGQHAATAANVLPVPEPGTWLLSLWWVLAVLRSWRRR